MKKIALFIQDDEFGEARVQRALAGLGWEVLTLWECELADRDALRAKIRAFLDDSA